MDLFEEYLAKQDNEYVKQALTDKSYKSYCSRGIKGGNGQCNFEVNTNMATYGDAIIKMILTGYLWNDVKKPTVEKSGLESDLMWVEVIGRHYDILSYLHFDIEDSKMPQNYDYRSTDDTNKNPHKYIATCVEAMVAAIYLDSPKENFEKLRQLITEQWVPMIQSSDVYKAWKECENIVDEINLSEKVGTLALYNATEKLNELTYLGLVAKPKEENSFVYGPDGATVWTVTFTMACTEMSFTNTDRSKKDAERKCAYDLLKHLIEQ